MLQQSRESRNHQVLHLLARQRLLPGEEVLGLIAVSKAGRFVQQLDADGEVVLAGGRVGMAGVLLNEINGGAGYALGFDAKALQQMGHNAFPAGDIALNPRGPEQLAELLSQVAAADRR